MEVDGATALLEANEEESSSEKLSGEIILYTPPESLADSPRNPEDYEEITGSNHASGEVQNAADTRDASVVHFSPIEGSQETRDVELSERMPLNPSTLEESYQTTIYVRSNSLNQSPGLPCYQVGCCYALQRFSRVFTTPYALPFYFILMCFPIAAGYISAVYMDSCPVSKYLASQFLGAAICAVICLTCRIVEILCDTFVFECPPGNIIFFSHLFTQGAMLLLLIGEVLAVMAISHEVDTSDFRSNYYCHPVFYNACYYGSIGTIAFIVFCCIFLPGSMCVRCGCLCARNANM